ncbi:MAG: hypothetical protein Q7J25_11360 [Vicinamibacterales bacterium]|nr:hypothetical protein [Vicinamibacterales bacterium]
MMPSKTSVLAEIRRSVSANKFNPEWIEEAVTAAAAVPYHDDPDTYFTAVCAAVQAVLMARIAAQNARTRALNKKTDAQMAANAAEAACDKIPDRNIKH